MFNYVPLEHKLALLNPNAYDYVYAPTLSQTVPSGTTWYALNLWHMKINGGGNYFHRSLNIFAAMVLPQGTTITQGSQAAFAYICKPETVSVPASPQSVFDQRMTKLLQMPLYYVRGQIPAGSAPGTYVGALMASDFADGIWRHVSTQDLSWTIMIGNQAPAMPAGNYDSLNTLEEINDSHVIRFTGNILCPFKRSRWNGIWVKAGSNSGNATDLSQAGVGIVTFNKLDSNW